MRNASAPAAPVLSKTADYALRALLVLARRADGRAVPAEVIAARTGAPANYLGKTLHALAKAGLVRSTRGPAGGFALAVAPESLTIARIAEVFAEHHGTRSCLLGTGPCNADAPCAAHVHWTRVTDASRRPLATTTIADLLADAPPVAIGEHATPSTTASGAADALRGASTMSAPMKTIARSIALTAAALLSFAGATACTTAKAANDERAVPTASFPEIRGEEKAVLTDAPAVPAPITRDYATKVVVELETVETVKRLADGVDYAVWTFGGDVPGRFIRVREGDLVEFHLKNHPHSTVPHNIDLHAVTGPGGGAAATLTLPGGESIFTFRALNPGLYVYHCAVSPVPMHIANGMYGMILVEPKGGLPKVDREFYVMQSEFYPKAGEKGAPATLDMEKGAAEQPTYVVFNGAVGALAGDKALQAKVGESIRLFVGNGGPNLVSSFHVIGEVFDNVYGEGGTSVSQHNVQTTLVPAGGSAIVEFRADKPGNLVLVDHSIFRAFNKGALGMIKVTGDDDLRVYSQVKGIGMAAH